MANKRQTTLDESSSMGNATLSLFSTELSHSQNSTMRGSETKRLTHHESGFLLKGCTVQRFLTDFGGTFVSALETKTFPDAGSNDQDKVSPASSPKSITTAPGTVVRSDLEEGRALTRCDSAVGNDQSPLTLFTPKINNYGLNIGSVFDQRFKYFRPYIGLRNGLKGKIKMTAAGSRRQKALKLLEAHPDWVVRMNRNTFAVQSESGNATYIVRRHRSFWRCECGDFMKRGVVCKHIFMVMESVEPKHKTTDKTVISPVQGPQCRYCRSTDIVKCGTRVNKYGTVQRYKCRNCGRRAAWNPGFERMRATPEDIIEALQLFFSGESTRKIAEFMRLRGIMVDHTTVYRWIVKFMNLMATYMAQFTPQLSPIWRADEIFVKVRGKLKYLFRLMDDETRYIIAEEVADSKFKHDARGLLKKGKEVAKTRPRLFITDGLQSYEDAARKEFYTNTGTRTAHLNTIKLDHDSNNNEMERANGEFRHREKTVRGIKKKDSVFFQGYRLYHNFIRPST
jgi:transposase-like protein